MKDKIIGAFLALIFGGLVTLSYAFRRQLQTAGFPLDPYFFSLFAIPILLLILVKGYSLLPLLMTGLIGLYFSFAKDKSGGDSLVYPAGAHSLYNLVATLIR